MEAKFWHLWSWGKRLCWNSSLQLACQVRKLFRFAKNVQWKRQFVLIRLRCPDLWIEASWFGYSGISSTAPNRKADLSSECSNDLPFVSMVVLQQTAICIEQSRKCSINCRHIQVTAYMIAGGSEVFGEGAMPSSQSRCQQRGLAMACYWGKGRFLHAGDCGPGSND